MGGIGSGRKTIKGEAIKCIARTQLDLIRLIYDGFDGPATREELKAMTQEILKETKITQEELERL